MTALATGGYISDAPIWCEADPPELITPAPTAADDEPAPELDPLTEIEALDRADWHLQHVARLRHDQHVHDELYRRAIDRLQDRAETRRTIIQRQIDWHLTPVRQLHDRLLEINPKRKTIELPHGDLRMRVPEKPQVFIDDQDALVAWAKTNALELLPLPDRVKVTDLRRVFPHGVTGHGETVPGVHTEIPAPTWNADTEVEP